METEAIVATDLVVATAPVVGTVPIIAPAPTVPTAAVREADAPAYDLTNLAMTRPAAVIPTVRSTMAMSV